MQQFKDFSQLQDLSKKMKWGIPSRSMDWVLRMDHSTTAKKKSLWWLALSMEWLEWRWSSGKTQPLESLSQHTGSSSYTCWQMTLSSYGQNTCRRPFINWNLIYKRSSTRKTFKANWTSSRMSRTSRRMSRTSRRTSSRWWRMRWTRLIEEVRMSYSC